MHAKYKTFKSESRHSYHIFELCILTIDTMYMENKLSVSVLAHHDAIISSETSLTHFV